MRLVIETTQEDRKALGALVVRVGAPSYSALFRVLLRFALDGTTKLVDISRALDQRRPVLNVVLEAGPTVPKIDFSAPPTKQEDRDIGYYMRHHPDVQVNLKKWRQGFYKEEPLTPTRKRK